MARILSLRALLPFAALTCLASAAAAFEAPSAAPQGLPICLVGLGADDGSPAWSQLDLTSSRSVDLDLADGAGLTVACGTFVAPKYRPASIVAPVGSADPSAKGDFGRL